MGVTAIPYQKFAISESKSWAIAFPSLNLENGVGAIADLGEILLIGVALCHHASSVALGRWVSLNLQSASDVKCDRSNFDRLG
ncbi:MAG: hypothetical protein F6K09_05980 [Merismopedia sp. SIO2A8]|nr:hypothetical protein [Merismopedia sp. SIO2A8]